ncbi:MAG: CcdB family protein [Bauldia sp.]
MSRQFDVHRNAFADGASDPPFLVNLQSDHLEPIRTVVVAPLWPESDHARPPVFVPIRFSRGEYWLAINELAYIRTSSLGAVAGTLAAQRDRIIRALDLLFTGV